MMIFWVNRLLLANLLSCFFVMLWPATEAAAQESVDVVFTLPSCDGGKYLVPAQTQAGGQINAPFGRLFCRSSDFGPAPAGTSALLSVLAPRVAGKVARSIALSTYYASSVEFADWVCANFAKDKPEITIYGQASQDPNRFVSSAFASTLAACMPQVRVLLAGCSVFELSDNVDDNEGEEAAKCPKGAVNSMHLKLLKFDFSDSASLIVSGSGNLNKSLYANIENWVIVTSRVGLPLERTHHCMLDVVHASAGLPVITPGFSTQVYKNCLSSFNSVLAVDSESWFGLAPSDAAAYKKLLVGGIKAASRVVIVSQVLEDRDIIGALEQNASANIQIVMDDDWYWASVYKKDFGVASSAKALALSTLFAKPNVQVRYLQTNHNGDGGLRNTLHTRIVLVESVDGPKSVFTGSAHLRAGSLQSNFESLILLNQPATTDSYESFTRNLWERSLARSDMPVTDNPVN